MSKNMKGVALESSIHGSFMYKHQRLIQGYQKLEKESEAAKNKLEFMKQRKLTLLAEVRFLQQRHTHLLEMKLQNSTPKRGENMKEKGSSSKKSTLKLKESHVNQKEKKKNRKDSFFKNKNTGFNHPSEVLNLKEKERLFVGEDVNFQKKLGFDLNQMDISYPVREEAMQIKAPVFDLNLKLGEEEDLQESYDVSKCEEPNNIFSGGNEDQLNDLKLSICRNVETVPSRTGKRKISWQDQVALKV